MKDICPKQKADIEVLNPIKMNEQFYNRGRSDSLRKLPANPCSSTPDQYNHYMNGYNSIQQKNPGYDQAFEGICGIITRSQNLGKIKDITLRLAELLVASINEPADIKTNLDEEFAKQLCELRIYDSKLEDGIMQLYNSVQKSKCFGREDLSKVKYLSHKPQEVQKKNTKKKPKKS